MQIGARFQPKDDTVTLPEKATAQHIPGVGMGNGLVTGQGRQAVQGSRRCSRRGVPLAATIQRVEAAHIGWAGRGVKERVGKGDRARGKNLRRGVGAIQHGFVQWQKLDFGIDRLVGL